MLDQAFSASPKFVPRLNFATADSELAGISLSWEDSLDLGDHLLVILKLERVRVALALIDAGWRIAAVLQLPVVLQQCHPDDIVGPLEDVAIRVLRNSADSFEGLLWVERIWRRVYPKDPVQPDASGALLDSSNVNWYRVKCQFLAGIPVLTCELERTETERGNVQFWTIMHLTEHRYADTSSGVEVEKSPPAGALGIVVTPQMRLAGAIALERGAGSLSQEELAEAAYRAMVPLSRRPKRLSARKAGAIPA